MPADIEGLIAMTGKCYYIATLGAWRRHTARFANSHFVIMDALNDDRSNPPESARNLALIEADEGAHNALEDDSAFERLPHPLAQKPISDSVRAALRERNLGPEATTFDVAEAVALVHPLLRYRVF